MTELVHLQIWYLITIYKQVNALQLLPLFAECCSGLEQSHTELLNNVQEVTITKAGKELTKF